MRMVGVGCWLGLLLLGLGTVGCSAPIKPFNEPVFRVRTEIKPQGCTDPSKQLCRWEIQGVVSSVSIAADDNPFSNCTNCKFNQKYAIEDTGGGLHYVYYGLPTDDHAPLKVGTPVKLLYIEAAVVGQGYALSLRHRDGSLLMAMTSGAGGSLLKPEDLGSVKISVNESEDIGSETNECGTKNYRLLQFSLGNSSVSLAPGKSSALASSGTSYLVGNVNRFNWSNSKCSNLGATPYSYFVMQN